MGLPAFRVTEHVQSDLPAILSAAGLAVIPEDVSEKEAERGIVMALTCRSPDEEVVGVSVHRLRIVGPHNFLVVLHPLSASWRIRGDRRLLKRIELVLRTCGATDLGPARGDGESERPDP